MNNCEMINYLEEQYWRQDPADQHKFSQMVKHFTEMVEENEKLKKENKKLMLRSHRSVVKLNTENKELKKRIDKVEMRLDASQQVNVCYAKVAGQANKIDELCSNIEVKGDWISDYMAKA